MATKVTVETTASSPEGVSTQAKSVDHMVSEPAYEFDPADIGLDIAEGELSESSLTGLDDEASEETEETTEETTETETTETSSSEESEETKETGTEETSEKSDEEKETKESSAEKKSAASESLEDSTKPPTGFVPLEALREARDANRDLRESNRTLLSRLDRLEQRIDSPETKEPEDTFEVLTREKYDELAVDNPSEAMKYLMDLKVHEDKQREIQETEKRQQNTAEYIDDVVADTTRLMEAELPGVTKQDSDMYKGLIEFAPKVGFEQDMFYLTNPATQVILPGETEPLLLGDQALSMLKILNNAKTQVSEAEAKVPDEAALRESIEAELRPKIQQELMAKIKTGETEEFRSTTTIPRTEDEEQTSFKGKSLSENEFARLSPAEQEQYLAGE